LKIALTIDASSATALDPYGREVYLNAAKAFMRSRMLTAIPHNIRLWERETPNF